MAVALASPPLPPPPSQLKFSSSTERRCRCSCTSALSQSDSISSPSTATSTACRSAVILPGLGNNTNDYQKLALILKDYGVPTVTAKVSRIDWLRNAAGLLDSNYWRGTLRPRPVLDWYLERVEEAVNEAKELTEGSTLSLIGHSAGGWLARVYLQEFGITDVSLLLTLGTPHLAPPKGVSGVIDQTRGLLDYVEKHCAKAVYTPELRYICIAGRYIQGARLLGSSNDENQEVMVEMGQAVGEMAAVKTSVTLQDRFVGQGYKQIVELDVRPDFLHSFNPRNFWYTHKILEDERYWFRLHYPRRFGCLLLLWYFWSGGGGDLFTRGGGDSGFESGRGGRPRGGEQNPRAPEQSRCSRHRFSSRVLDAERFRDSVAIHTDERKG